MASHKLPLPSQIIGRVFALVELVRSLADYLIAPVAVQIAREASGKQLDASAVHLGTQVLLWLTVGFALFGGALFMLGRSGLPRPDLEPWLANRSTAIQPAPLLGRLRTSVRR